MKKTESLKKSFAILVILLAIALPWACTTNNTSSGPTSPGGGGTTTPGGATATPTQTLVPGTTATFTPTPPGTAPIFVQDISLSIQPNAFYCEPGTTRVMVATGGVTQGGDVTMMEIYPGSGPFASTNGNTVWVGIPT